MSRDIKCYHMPRKLSQYGKTAFMVEELPDKKGSVFFIEKPDWCKPFESFSISKDIGNIFNIMARGMLYCSIDGIIANNILHENGDRADEYKDLEKQLSDIQVDIEHAMHEGRWMKWMKENVEAPARKTNDFCYACDTLMKVSCNHKKDTDEQS